VVWQTLTNKLVLQGLEN